MGIRVRASSGWIRRPRGFGFVVASALNFRADELLFGQISRGSTAWARSRIGCKPWSRVPFKTGGNTNRDSKVARRRLLAGGTCGTLAYTTRIARAQQGSLHSVGTGAVCSFPYPNSGRITPSKHASAPSCRGTPAGTLGHPSRPRFRARSPGGAFARRPRKGAPSDVPRAFVAGRFSLTRMRHSQPTEAGVENRAFAT